MNEIVFLSPNTKEPFTTSEVIAEAVGVKRDTVQKLISRNEKDFKEFGLLGFEIRPVKMKRGTKSIKVFHLNEQQATLLMTYMKNNDIVRAFKKELVRQFYSMRNELMNVRLAKASRKEIRLNMTDSIKALPDSPHKNFKYSQYTNLAYLFVTGKTAKAIRQERGAKKNAAASDYMTAEEILKIADAENRISVLIDAGFDYGQIKSALYMSRVAIA